jgi:hypothetical protein
MRDPLSGCRGILNGLLLGAAFWAIVAVIVLAIIWLPAIIH